MGGRLVTIRGEGDWHERLPKIKSKSKAGAAHPTALLPSLPLPLLPRYLNLGVVRLRLSFLDEALEHLGRQDSGHGLEQAGVGGSVGEAVFQEGLFWFSVGNSGVV